MMNMDKTDYHITQHICPRNCYDTCSMLAYSKNGIIEKIIGDPNQDYTNGKICTKGYSYIDRLYHPERLKYPMIQEIRGSNKWKRISWEYAIDCITDKMIALNKRYASNLSLCLNKYSGNFGFLHNATERLFDGLGATTRTIGSPCWSAGMDAQFYDFGGNETSDPTSIQFAKTIILWGTNPAWTAIHTMPYIYRAQENGATVIVIDPIYTTSAKRADIYVQIKPGEDGVLALAIAKILFDRNLYDHDFVTNHSTGWNQFTNYLKTLDIVQLAEQCQVKPAVMEHLALQLAKTKNNFVWIGFGMQRHRHGGQNVRAIDALTAMTGSIGNHGGGVHFAQLTTWNFNSMKKKALAENRQVDINCFAQAVQTAQNPPLQFLWIACRNLLTQEPQTAQLKAALQGIEMIVTVDHFLTPTAQLSDIALPATMLFEEEDIVASYWHHYIGYNQKATEPYYESKSDLEIAQLISIALNQKEPDFCKFPTNGSAADFIEREFNQEMYDLLAINHWHELKHRPLKAKIANTAWADKKFTTPSGKFEFFSERAVQDGFTGLATVADPIKADEKFPLRLITPHAQHGLNSQFQNFDWLISEKPLPVGYINAEVAQSLGLKKNFAAILYNDLGEIEIKIYPTTDVPKDIVVFYQGWYHDSSVYINNLVYNQPTDMGKRSTGTAGVAYYDTFVNIRKKE